MLFASVYVLLHILTLNSLCVRVATVIFSRNCNLHNLELGGVLNWHTKLPEQ